VPDNENIDSLIKMLEDVGEKEQELGVLSKEEIAGYQQKTAGLAARVVHEEVTVEGVEGTAAEEADVFDGDLTDLLNDIEIGLTEEKELEEQFRKKEETAGEPSEAGAGEASGEEGLSEEDFDKLFEEAAAVEPEEAPAAPEGEMAEEKLPAQPPEAMADEEGFDLPVDFDMSGLDIEEGPPEGLFKEEKPEEEVLEEAKDIEAPELPPEEEVLEEISPEEEQIEEQPMEIPSAGLESGEVEEPSFDDFDMPDLDEIGSIEDTLSPSIAEGEGAGPGIDSIIEEVSEVPDMDIPEVLEGGPSAAEIPGDDEFNFPEFTETADEAADLIEEAEPVEELVEEGEEITEVSGEIEERAVAAPGEEVEIELSEEDIVLITTKLRQINPAAGSRIRDLIVKVELSIESLKELLELLILDVPEEDILQFIERTTGEKIVTRRIPEVIPARKPGRIADLMASLGPLVRITGLSVAIVGVIGLLFMVFLYNPLRSSKYYKEGLEYIRQENYPEAENNFQRATDIYKKIKEYDKFGWEYMVSGKYDDAIEKFTEGIKEDETIRNLDIRMNFAMLHNVRGKYEEADRLYDEILSKNTGKYEFSKAKGKNLIDWGKDAPAKLTAAYSLFEEIYSKDKKNRNDALTQMLNVRIIQKDSTNIDIRYKELKDRYPGHIDKEVYTKLAEHYLSKDETEIVRDLLGGVLTDSYNYPQANFVFSEYYKKLDNKDKEESYLNQTIQYEKNRDLQYPWDTRNRELLSKAFNNLGELYDRMELPGKSAEAINYFKQAIEENEENEVAYFNLAQVYFYEVKNKKFAKKYYELAKDKGYEENDLYYNLGYLYYDEKSYDEALIQWYELSEKVPNNPNVKFAMGNAFLHKGKYNSAMGELLMLSELYSDLIEGLGEIKPWRAYHKKIIRGASSVYSNLGVAYQSMYKETESAEHQKNSLINLYKAGELADILGVDWGPIQLNINYIVHPDVPHEMVINESISDNYKFITQ